MMMTKDYMQDFMATYDQLRDELLNDDIIAGQPEFAKQHLKRVSGHEPYFKYLPQILV